MVEALRDVGALCGRTAPRSPQLLSTHWHYSGGDALISLNGVIQLQVFDDAQINMVATEATE